MENHWNNWPEPLLHPYKVISLSYYEELGGWYLVCGVVIIAFLLKVGMINLIFKSNANITTPGIHHLHQDFMRKMGFSHDTMRNFSWRIVILSLGSKVSCHIIKHARKSLPTNIIWKGQGFSNFIWSMIFFFQVRIFYILNKAKYPKGTQQQRELKINPISSPVFQTNK